jgi:hypothetical protein
MAPTFASTFDVIVTNINLVDGSNVINGATIGNGVVSLSINEQGHVSTFNPIVVFFHELQINYQGVWMEKI